MSEKRCTGCGLMKPTEGGKLRVSARGERHTVRFKCAGCVSIALLPAAERDDRSKSLRLKSGMGRKLSGGHRFVGGAL